MNYNRYTPRYHVRGRPNRIYNYNSNYNRQCDLMNQNTLYNLYEFIENSSGTNNNAVINFDRAGRVRNISYNYTSFNRRRIIRNFRRRYR